MISTSISAEGQNFINALKNIQQQLNTSQAQVATGLLVNQPSDAPDELSPILQLHAQILQNQTLQTTLNSSLTTINSAENALSSSVTLLQNASSIATQATSLNETAATRTALAQSVQSVMEQMVANANTAVDGKFVFSGDQNTTQLYQLDPTSPTGVSRLAIATNTDLVQGADGIHIQASLTANAIFDARNPDDSVSQNNIFAALNGLEAALQNDDMTGINTAINNLQAASTWMNNQLAFYGTAQDQINSSLSSAQNSATQLQTQLSQLTDANEATSITQLTQAQTQMQEAIAAQARMPTQTLFDVLPPG